MTSCVIGDMDVKIQELFLTTPSLSACCELGVTNTAFSTYIFLKYLEHPGTRAISNAAALLNVGERHSVVDPQLGPRESRAVIVTWHVTIALSTDP